MHISAKLTHFVNLADRRSDQTYELAGGAALFFSMILCTNIYNKFKKTLKSLN